MGKVAVVIKVFPESAEAHAGVRKEIEARFKPARIVEEEIAFGMKALRITFIMDDKEGSGDIEEKIKGIAGVSEAQVEEVTLV